MTEKENECWKLLNRELREAKAAATTRESYPQRTRFDQAIYDRLAAEAWKRCRERMELVRRDVSTAPTMPMQRVALAETLPNPLPMTPSLSVSPSLSAPLSPSLNPPMPSLNAIVTMPAATSDSGPTHAP